MKKHISKRIVASALGLAVFGTVTAAHAVHVVCASFWQDQFFSGPQFTVENNQNISNVGWFNDKATGIRMYQNCFCVTGTDVNLGGTPGYWGNNQEFNNMGVQVGLVYNDSMSSVACWIP